MWLEKKKILPTWGGEGGGLCSYAWFRMDRIKKQTAIDMNRPTKKKERL